MNNKLVKIVGLVAGLVISAPTWALLIADGIDVGGLDTFVASTTLSNSGDAVEIAWVNESLDIEDAYITYYDDDSVAGMWNAVTDSGYDNTFAYEFDFGNVYNPEYPEYYYLKLGTGHSDVDTHYLFSNSDEMAYAVIDFGDLGFADADFRFNLGRISHIVGTGGSTAVPEPASIALMGLGLLGMGIVAQRRRKQSW